MTSRNRRASRRQVAKRSTTSRNVITQLAVSNRASNRTSQGNWLDHYLPVDRPRIKGGIWKYVSTETDHYYYRPDSPAMLRQSPDQVIGFASAADAEAAGYELGPNMNAFDRQGGQWFRLGSSTPIRVTTSPRQGSLRFSVPVSQIPRDVYVIIRATDILADAIDQAPDSDTAGAIYRMLRRMRWGSEDYIDLSEVTGNREAFADSTRWYPILEMLEQGALAKMNRGGMAEVNRALSRQSTQMARNNARMLMPQVQAVINRRFRDRVTEENQRMLRR